MAKAAGAVLKRGLGQHLLKSPATAAKIVRSAHVLPGARVLEIGPGTGALTLPLLEAVGPSGRVFALETDRDMATRLQERVASAGFGDRCKIVLGDALVAPWPKTATMCVANIPYQISSPLVRRLLAHAPRMESHTLLVQKEFADRLAGVPGQSTWCRLAANTQLRADARVLLQVSRHEFVPPPAVESAVVQIKPLPAARVPLPPSWDDAAWENTLRLVFSGRNKTLRAMFAKAGTAARVMPTAQGSRSLPDPAAVLAQVLDRTRLGDHRANAMTLEQLVQLHTALADSGVCFSAGPRPRQQ